MLMVFLEKKRFCALGYVSGSGKGIKFLAGKAGQNMK
jgi:hypothetical protein